MDLVYRLADDIKMKISRQRWSRQPQGRHHTRGPATSPTSSSHDRRASKVLSASKQMPEKQKRIYERNASDSALLSLPPEVRNRIWEHLLTGHTVHVWSPRFDGKPLRRCICKCAPADNDQTEIARFQSLKGKNVESESTDFEAYEKRHAQCQPFRPSEYATLPELFSNSMPAYAQRFYQPGHMASGVDGRVGIPRYTTGLQVLQACRQIHDEAAMLFYEHNTFAFSWVLDLEGWLKALMLDQTRAVKDLTFLHHHFNSGETFERLLQHRLHDLDRLSIIAAAADYRSTGPYVPPVETAALHFCRLRIKDVKVMVIGSVSRRDLLQTAHVIENVLIKPSDA